MEFRLNQELVRHHREGCIYHGIPRKKKRMTQAQFPIMFGQFLGRLNRAFVEYTVGTSRPGISLRFTNIVPRDQSPLLQTLYDPTHEHERGSLLLIHYMPLEKAFCRLKEFEKNVLSLYQEGKSSPWDLTEDGDSHETVRRISHSPAGYVVQPQPKLTCDTFSYFLGPFGNFALLQRTVAIKKASQKLALAFSRGWPL